MENRIHIGIENSLIKIIKSGANYIKKGIEIMSRIARKYKDALFFHVIVQGIGKEEIFSKERYKNEYLKLIGLATKKANIEIICYCIMDNHAHFLLHIENLNKISLVMQKVNSKYARYYNYIENGRVGYVFRDRFLSEAIKNKKYLINCIKYIHNNPVKARIIKHCAEYRFSSYNSYLKMLKQNNEYQKIFSKEELVDILYNTKSNRICMDVDNNIDEIINSAILNFVEKEQISFFSIYESREKLIELIKYLKNVEKIKYTDIMNKFNFSKSMMDVLLADIRKEKRMTNNQN